MKGFSGDFFERKGELVTKYSYNERLLEQGRRQQEFRTDVPKLTACPVVSIGEHENAFQITMPFINGVCPLLLPKPQLLTVFEYFYERLQQSTMCDVSADILLDKLEKLERRIWMTTFTPPAWQIPFSECRKVFRDGLKNIPIGKCHGDFTFTNMLQTDHELVLFDFLDNVFDSVLLDMVKLRQDTAHHWVNVVLDRIVDEAKLKQLDQDIASELRWYECYRQYYRAVQQYNLLRILPYCHDHHATNFVITELNKV